MAGGVGLRGDDAGRLRFHRHALALWPQALGDGTARLDLAAVRDPIDILDRPGRRRGPDSDPLHDRADALQHASAGPFQCRTGGGRSAGPLRPRAPGPLRQRCGRARLRLCRYACSEQSRDKFGCSALGLERLRVAELRRLERPGRRPRNQPHVELSSRGAVECRDTRSRVLRAVPGFCVRISARSAAHLRERYPRRWPRRLPVPALRQHHRGSDGRSGPDVLYLCRDRVRLSRTRSGRGAQCFRGLDRAGRSRDTGPAR